jgi:hypothetical protein
MSAVAAEGDAMAVNSTILGTRRRAPGHTARARAPAPPSEARKLLKSKQPAAFPERRPVKPVGFGVSSRSPLALSEIVAFSVAPGFSLADATPSGVRSS